MAISIAREHSLRRRLLTLTFAFVFVLTLALPAEAASATVTFNNTCKVKIENGSGINSPWGRTTEIENCAQLRASVHYWNGTGWAWRDSSPLWQSSSQVQSQPLSGISTYDKSRHGGRNVTGSGGRCIDLTKNGSLGSFFNC